MKKFDKLLITLILGSTFPLLLCMLSFLIWFYNGRPENRIPVYLITGVITGLIIDFRFLRGWIYKMYELPVWFIIMIYFFYNVCVYGMFMGFPVFNILSGVVAGYYYGKRICFKKVPLEKHSKLINRVSLFTGLIITFFCISSAFLATAGEGAGNDLKGMFGLVSEVTETMIWGIILIGGTLLITGQILLTKLILVKTIKYNYTT